MEEDKHQQSPIADEQSPSDQNRQLKRLKRAFEQPESQFLDSGPLGDDESPTKSADSAESKDEIVGSEYRSAGFERERESEEFDALFPWEGERSGVKRVLEFNTDGDSSDGFGLERDSENQGLDGGLDGVEEGKKESKKRVKDSGGDEGKKVRKKKKKDDPTAKASKRKENQERKAEATLFVEHQRQLRERRDVAFKPLPAVQKPISSVLERIRQRKQQVSVKASSSFSNQFSDPLGEILVDSDTEEVVIVRKEDIKINSSPEEQVDPTVVKEDHHPSSQGSGRDLSQLGDGQDSVLMPSVEHKEELSTAFRPPTNDTQDLFSESQDNNPVMETESSQDEDATPSLPSMNLKLDSAPLDDSSSDDDSEEEEENDKENINPLTGQLFNENLSSRGDPVKAFLDEEALEDDCSDEERRRFEEDIEDYSDAEEIAELIATNYSEKPVDHERRNELHQMWLAHQDEAGTENLLQRLKCKVKKTDTTLLDEEDEEDQNTDEMDVELSNEEDQPTNVTRLSTKQLRKMIPLMFTDKDDSYISSDDEETERSLSRQSLLGNIEFKERAVFQSPAENETSREVFGRIKKLNLVATKKKVKTSTFFEKLVTKGSGSNSAKSSFLNRMSSIPVSSKRTSNAVKAFIFGRDDSNSRSSITASEEDSMNATNQVETIIQRKKNFTAKFSSQARKSTQTTVETSYNTSLIDVLKRSSVQTTSFARDEIMVDHQAAFAAFKASKRPLKILLPFTNTLSHRQAALGALAYPVLVT